MKQHLLAVSVVLTFCGAIAAEALVQPNPNQLIAQRKGAMNLQAKYFGPLLGMGLGRVPYDARIAQRNADYLAVVTQMAWDDFQPHTAGAQNTRAKEDIYKDPGKFKAAIENLQGEIKKLGAAVNTGDQNPLKPAVQAVGRACNTCHESFATFDFRFRLE